MLRVRSLSLLTLIVLLSQVQSVPAQTDFRSHTFDVVSIKPAASGQAIHFGFTNDGYSATGVPLTVLIGQAFFSGTSGGKIVGEPDWLNKNLYDVEAKVTSDDLDEWKKELSMPSKPLMQRLLQSMLADRCKIAVHRVPSQTAGYELTVDKNGPKINEAQADEPRPEHGIPITGGGYLVPYQRDEEPRLRFYGVTIAQFAERLAGLGGGHVVDRTGLTGHYDINLVRFSPSPDEKHVRSVDPGDPDPLSHWNFGALGLKAQQTRLPTEDLVIDHIEKPSVN
jgi:uncharacterized protein (TIGR03435 family)